MRVVYLDTSAAAKLVLNEPERDRLIRYLADPELVLVSSWLLYTELLCAVGRPPQQIAAESARQVLDLIELIDLERNDLISATSLAPLRSHEAIHLAVALRVQATALVTYDLELAEAAAKRALPVVAPV